MSKFTIGDTFPTLKGGWCTIQSMHSIKSSKSLNYVLECSICSKDEELFPKGSISTTSTRINKGLFGCGCSTRVNWSERQFKVLVERKCLERGYLFSGWVNEFSTMNKTYLKLSNDNTGNYWETTNLSKFLLGNRGDPVEGRKIVEDGNRFPEQVHIETIYKQGNLVEGSVVTKNLVKRTTQGMEFYYDVYCPICSEDEYVQQGLCNGVFTAFVTTLKNGQVPCRCGVTKPLTEPQCLYEINKVFVSEGGTFMGWDGVYRGKAGDFNWMCKNGHVNRTGIGPFIRDKRRCSVCRCGIYGWCNNLREDKDYLYIVIFPNKYIKIGRSFNPPNRLKQLKNISKVKDAFICKLYKGTHLEVYDLEQEIHKVLYDKGEDHKLSYWSIETFNLKVLDFCKDYISKQLEEVYYEDK